MQRRRTADVTEGEGPEERTQGRGGVGACEDPAHPAVAQQRHVVDGVGAGDHPRDQRGDLQPCVRALVGRHPQMRWASARSPTDPANATTGTNPADATRFGSSKTAEVAPDVWESCTCRMPFVLRRVEP